MHIKAYLMPRALRALVPFMPHSSRASCPACSRASRALYHMCALAWRNACLTRSHAFRASCTTCSRTPRVLRILSPYVSCALCFLVLVESHVVRPLLLLIHHLLQVSNILICILCLVEFMSCGSCAFYAWAIWVFDGLG